MRVRKATPRDVEEVCAVQRAATAARGIARDGVERAVPRRAGNRSDPIDFDGFDAALVAEADGRVVGFASITPRPGGDLAGRADAEITAVSVHPDVARSGVRSRLLRALETVARVWNAETLAVAASVDTVGVYERVGFQRRREAPGDGPRDGDGQVVEMTKALRGHARASRTAGRTR